MEKIQILNGNELIVRGGLEAGFSLYTGYPGSPLADYFNILFKQRNELLGKGIKVVLANSEANAAAMASGAKQAGRDCLVAMKSMGLHVAADALSVGNFADPGPEFKVDGITEKAGVVVVVGDDPWSLSTSTAADSRFLYKHLHIPFLEPSTPQELKDWIAHSLYLSRRSSVYSGLLLTTYMAEGGGRVELGEEKPVKLEAEDIDTSKFDLSKNVMVPPNSLKADTTMIRERFPRVKNILRELNLDQQYGNTGHFKLGFLAAGSVFEVLKQVLEEHNLLEQFPLYKVACPYPLLEDKLVPFIKNLDTLVVVEEKRGFLETELDELIQKNQLQVKLFGKEFKTSDSKSEGFPAFGGLNYEIVSEKIRKIFEMLNINPCHWEQSSLYQWEDALPKRLPTFCPGCPHRETLSLLKDIRKTLKKKDIDLISHGDVGCYSLSFLPPFKEMHNLSAMGQGGALGAGMDMFTNNPSVVLMGDSTFFHSGLTDISNSVQCGHNITYILLNNDNTAMTGHQMTPKSGISVDGRTRPEQDMLKLVRALGVNFSKEVNPSDRYFYRNLLLDIVQKPGVKVIVSNKECGLTFHGRQRAEERRHFEHGDVIPTKKFFQINTAACEDCRECVEMTGCPGLTQINDAYGTKVSIDPQICVSDGYCTQIKACPSFEMVEVVNYHPSKYKDQKQVSLSFDHLPDPQMVKTFNQIAQGQDWRCVVTGVGGSGVTTVSRVLAEAAKSMGGREDLDFKFVDQKGLAQRNGNVTGHMAIYKKGKSYAVPTPLGTADLYFSPDLLDGSQHIQFLSPSGLAILDSQFQMPLSILLDNGEEKEALNAKVLKEKLQQKLKDQQITFNFKHLSELMFGKSVYASSILLGVGFQLGRLPFSQNDLKSAFEKTMKKAEVDNNWMAFNIGRDIIVSGEEGVLRKIGNDAANVPVLRLLETSIMKSLLPWQNKKKHMQKYRSYIEKLRSNFDNIPEEHIHQYIHDIYLFDRGSRINKFFKNCEVIVKKYNSEKNRVMALRVLARNYFIKDEIFIAHVMLSPVEKYKKQLRFKDLGEDYFVTHINRPSFDIFGAKLEFDINPKDWMLTVMKHARILRILLPTWHHKERKISEQIQKKLLKVIPEMEETLQRSELQKIENIKGYREVRYEKADLKLSENHA